MTATVPLATAAAAIAATVAAAAAAAIMALFAPPAAAVELQPMAECPSEHRLTEPRALTAPPDEGAIREVLTYVALDGWRGVEGLSLRIRRITVAPGGFVPLHYHNDRPSVDYMIEGELVEHATHCAVPIVHRAGDSANRFGDYFGHWWRNETDKAVVLVSADVVPNQNVNF